MATKNQMTKSGEEMIGALLEDKFAAFFELAEREHQCADIVDGRSRRAAIMHMGYREEMTTAVERERLYLATLSRAELEALVQKWNRIKSGIHHTRRGYFSMSPLPRRTITTGHRKLIGRWSELHHCCWEKILISSISSPSSICTGPPRLQPSS